VKAILRRSCADCHSLETNWPWYAQIAPASWVVARDVRRAREHMNLSAWPEAPDIEEAEIADMVSAGTMPPGRYMLMHPGARLSEAERQVILKWVQGAGR
jgi:cytochrome c551/c552